MGIGLLAAQRRHIEAYIRALEQAGRSRATVARRLATLAGFYRYAVQEGALPHSPAAHIRRPSVARDSHRVLAVVGKGGQRMLVPLAPRTVRAIDAALGGRTDGPLLVATPAAGWTATTPPGSWPGSHDRPGWPSTSPRTSPRTACGTPW
jgi:integrase/recombinase XerD